MDAHVARRRVDLLVWLFVPSECAKLGEGERAIL
jgi:hypothetical protein